MVSALEHLVEVGRGYYGRLHVLPHLKLRVANFRKWSARPSVHRIKCFKGYQYTKHKRSRYRPTPRAPSFTSQERKNNSERVVPVPVLPFTWLSALAVLRHGTHGMGCDRPACNCRRAHRHTVSARRRRIRFAPHWLSCDDHAIGAWVVFFRLVLHLHCKSCGRRGDHPHRTAYGNSEKAREEISTAQGVMIARSANSFRASLTEWRPFFTN